jgi:hypothetical protein
MANTEDQLRDALSEIARVASAAVGDDNSLPEGDTQGQYAPPEDEAVCAPKRIPDRLQAEAAATATRVNPVNAPMMDVGGAEIMDPQALVVLTSKYWGPINRRLTVSFMESTPRDLRRRIIQHMNAWPIGISFVETGGKGTIRISRGGGGYWSYVGTDVLHIPRNRQTMNLAGFTMQTPESEYKRVVRHETGHTLGFPHEHMRRELIARIDPAKAYDYFWRTQGWSRQMVDRQVLTPLDQRSIVGTPPDQTSIMCYQLPGRITRDGRPIAGGNDINRTDASFARRIYPGIRGAFSTERALEGEADAAAFVEPTLPDAAS